MAESSDGDLVWYCEQHGIIEWQDWPDGLLIMDLFCPFAWEEHPKKPRPIGQISPWLDLKERSKLPANTPVHVWSYPLNEEVPYAN